MMKVSTEQLRSALQDCGRVMRGKTLSEITQNVRLSAPQDVLEIQSTNHDAWVTRTVECDEPTIPFLVNFRKLNEVIANTTSEFVNIGIAGPGRIALQSEGTKRVATLSVLQDTDWPSPPADGFKGVGIPLPELADGIEMAAGIADDSDDRTEAVIISASPTRLLVAGAEKGAHFWGIYNKPLMCEERKLLIHRRLAALLPDDLRQENAIFGASSNMARVIHDNGSVVVKLSERPPLPFEKYFEARMGLKGTYIDREAVLRVCRHAVAFTASDKSPTLYVERSGDAVKLFCKTATEDITDEVEAPGQPIRFAINAKYMSVAIGKSKADEVLVIDAHETLRAAFVEQENVLYILGLLNWEEAK